MPPEQPTYITETLELIERRPEYEGVATYIFRPRNPVEFKAGEYVHVRLLNMSPEVRAVREFSFASAPQDSDIWFGINERSGSDYQQALQSLKLGDTVELFKIRNHLTWPPQVEDVVMIAGGVGVTPFRSMLRDVKHRNLSLTTTLVHVSSDSYLYGEEMKELAGEYVSIGRPEFADTLVRVVAAHPDAHYYVAGSANFIQGVLVDLRAKGITRLESDVFKGMHVE